MFGGTTAETFLNITVCSFSESKKVYEERLAENIERKETTVKETSYRASLDDYDLQMFIVAEWVRLTLIKVLMKDNFVKKEVNIDAKNKMSLFLNMVKKGSLQMNRSSPEDTEWSLYRDYVKSILPGD